MNATGWMILSVIAFVTCWEGVTLINRWRELTISVTLRGWGPWAALAFMAGATLLFWHIWIQPESQWP